MKRFKFILNFFVILCWLTLGINCIIGHDIIFGILFIIGGVAYIIMFIIFDTILDSLSIDNYKYKLCKQLWPNYFDKIKLLHVQSSRQQVFYHSLKVQFKIYFDGINNVVDPVSNIHIFQLGITDITFNEQDGVTMMNITLERPGLLIGKGGSTYDAVTKYLSKPERPVKINIIESKLWN